MPLIRSLVLAATLLVPAVPARAAELVMFAAPGCAWCAAFDRDIGPLYAKTDEGRRAPLRRVELRQTPEDLAWIEGVRMTPTFVLVDGRREVGRITGYPGDEFFFGLLNRLLDKLGGPAEQAGPAS